MDKIMKCRKAFSATALDINKYEYNLKAVL